MGIKYFGFADQNGTPARLPRQPVRIMFLTSVRDVGVWDLNGSLVQTAKTRGYMQGVVEFTDRIARTPGSLLYGLVQIAGGIYDDLPRDLSASAYPLAPTAGRPWIYPRDLDLPLFHIPSAFRDLPMLDKDGRARAKLGFEAAVAEKMREQGAQVLISDHYMAKIEYLFPPLLPFGLVLNIHPAVTLPGHRFCFRGPTPTADAIARRKTEEAVMTGATLHVVNRVIDDGPIVAYSAATPVYEDDTPPDLRFRNYAVKREVFEWGLRHYLTRLYPRFLVPVSDELRLVPMD